MGIVYGLSDRSGNDHLGGLMKNYLGTLLFKDVGKLLVTDAHLAEIRSRVHVLQGAGSQIVHDHYLITTLNQGVDYM
jgi:hypothetical protein